MVLEQRLEGLKGVMVEKSSEKIPSLKNRKLGESIMVINSKHRRVRRSSYACFANPSAEGGSIDKPRPYPHYSRSTH